MYSHPNICVCLYIAEKATRGMKRMATPHTESATTRRAPTSLRESGRHRIRVLDNVRNRHLDWAMLFIIDGRRTSFTGRRNNRCPAGLLPLWTKSYTYMYRHCILSLTLKPIAIISLVSLITKLKPLQMI